MRRSAILLAAVAVLVAAPAPAQETPASMVGAYEALADTILAVRAAEANLVLALLDGHYHAAELLVGKQEWAGAAAHMALFANEGDNKVAGVRKRLLEGGHHFNAAGEEQGLFEEGYVIVGRAAKAAMLEAVAAMRQAQDEAAGAAAWEAFEAQAKPLLSSE